MAQLCKTESLKCRTLRVCVCVCVCWRVRAHAVQYHESNALQTVQKRTNENVCLEVVKLFGEGGCVLPFSGLLHSVMTQKTEEFSSTAAEAYDLAKVVIFVRGNVPANDQSRKLK
jgi:hypothetical protein